MLMMVVTLKWLLLSVLVDYLKRSRDDESVKKASTWRKEREVQGEF